MFDDEMIRFLHTGCALLVGTVAADGTPHAGRAWGLEVVDAAAGRIRLLVEADDAVTLANLQLGAPVAVTGADVRTLHSIQLKGRVVAVGAATEADEARRVRYTDDFIADIHDTDGMAPGPLHSWARTRIVACDIDASASFDQTPGPAAGSPVAEDRP